jgi:hypothetical protein
MRSGDGWRWPRHGRNTHVQRGGPSRTVPARHAARHLGPADGGARRGQKRRKKAATAAGAVWFRQRWVGSTEPETVSPPGVVRSKPKKHRARDAKGNGGLAEVAIRTASASRDVEVPRVLATPASRAPSDGGEGETAPGDGSKVTGAPGAGQTIRAAEQWSEHAQDGLSESIEHAISASRERAFPLPASGERVPERRRSRARAGEGAWPRV